MNIHSARSVLLKCFIGFLSLTALIGIATVLMGDFGQLQLKIMATTFSISAASICAMACAAFIEKRALPELGWTGIGLNFLAEVMLLLGIWVEMENEYFWKITITLIVLGLGLAHSLLLQLPDLGKANEWVQATAAASIGALAAMIIAAFWAEINTQAYYRVLGVVSIIVVLFTLIIPIMMKLGKPREPALVMASETPDTLTLTPLGNGDYRDTEGTRYRVEKLPD